MEAVIAVSWGFIASSIILAAITFFTSKNREKKRLMERLDDIEASIYNTKYRIARLEDDLSLLMRDLEERESGRILVKSKKPVRLNLDKREP